MLKEEEKNPGTVLDSEFIQNETAGFESWKENILSQDFSWLVENSGISLAQIQQTFEAIKHKKKIIACWAMGLTQHKNAVVTIQEVVNLLIAKGSIGKKGAGTCPVRGHSNVQGDRTMGIYEKPSPVFLENIEKSFGFKPPQDHGYDVVDCIKAMHQNRAKVFIAMGGNFLSATPDTIYTGEALEKCNLTVQI